MNDDLTVTEAATRLHVSRSRIYAHIRAGRLAAAKRGRDWFISEADLARLVVYPRGRPRR